MSVQLKPVIVPLLPMREEIVFPGATVPFFVGRQASMDALERAIAGDRAIFVVTQRDSSVENPDENDLYKFGVLGRVLQVMRLPNGTVKALFEGSRRGKLLATKLDEKEFLLNFNNNIYSNFLKNEIVEVASNVIVEFVENSDSFSERDWKELYKLSEDTFVEETESLKQSGAGAGLTDND